MQLQKLSASTSRYSSLFFPVPVSQFHPKSRSVKRKERKNKAAAPEPAVQEAPANPEVTVPEATAKVPVVPGPPATAPAAVPAGPGAPAFAAPEASVSSPLFLCA